MNLWYLIINVKFHTHKFKKNPLAPWMDPGFGNATIANKNRALAPAKKRFPLDKSSGDGHRFFMT